MNVNLTIDILGWLGAAALLLAYTGVSLGKLEARSRLYQVLNLVGSIGLVANAGWYGAFPSAFVNVIWISVALISLASLQRRQREPGTSDPS